MANETYDESFAEWRRLLKPFFANKSGEISLLEGHVTRLMDVLTQAGEIEGQQASLAAAKQERSQQLQGLVVEGRKIAAFVKAGLRDHYGRRSEKLTEYGLQPFRGFKKTTKPEEPVEAQTSKEDPATPSA